MSRPLTRSRASGVGPPPTSQDEPKESIIPATRTSVYRPTASLRRLIESRTRPGIITPNEFVHTVDLVLNKYIQRLLHALVVVSEHRAGVNKDNLDPSHRTVGLENWLLYKEDCATFFGKVMAAAAESKDQSPPAARPSNIVAPVFSESDYSVHALEEEAKLLLTARSVRQVCLRDLLPLILCQSEAIACPSVIKQQMVNKIAFAEVCADYRARGYANAIIPTSSVD